MNGLYFSSFMTHPKCILFIFILGFTLYLD